MASLILEHLDEEALVADVGNPFAFVRSFNRAAARARRAELQFAPATIDLLNVLEREYAIH